MWLTRCLSAVAELLVFSVLSVNRITQKFATNFSDIFVREKSNLVGFGSDLRSDVRICFLF